MKDPVSQLLEFVTEPNFDASSKFSAAMPYLFVRSDNRIQGNAIDASSAAIAALDGQAPFEEHGPDVCWTHVAGGLALTAGVQKVNNALQAVLAVDDRDDRLQYLDGAAWKEWLRLSNWLGISDASRVATRTLLNTAPSAESDVERDNVLPAAWQALLAEAVSDTERNLIRALADAGVAVPELGYETDSGEVIDMAWAGVRIGVNFDAVESPSGWTVYPADIGQLVSVLKSNGVV
jgi:hypothetical protein